MILFYEIVFAVIFALFTVFRAFAPDIFATEKYMDFSFLNLLLRERRAESRSTDASQ